MVDGTGSSGSTTRGWLTWLAVAWLVLALPCWWLCAMVFVSWAGGSHRPSICGSYPSYPCDVTFALAMVYAVIPVSAIVALVVVARALWRTLREEPRS
jgi:hypothetical protein